MEGRVPPAGGDETDANPQVGRLQPPPPPPPIPPPPLAYHAETYVIQVPKDQIYRIPPPENALIAERYRAPSMQKKKAARPCSFCLLVIGLILIILALIGIAITALSFAFNPKAPTFSVVQVIAKNPKSSPHKHSQPAYDISLRVNNPNDFMGIYYRTGGVATLSFKGKKFAKGKFPRLYQDLKKSTKIKVVLKGSSATLPHQIEKSMKDKKSKLPIMLALNVKFQVKMKLGTMKTWIIDTQVACKFKVSKLGVGSRILWQKCQTEFES